MYLLPNFILLSILFITISFCQQLVNGQSDKKAARQQKAEVLRLIEKAERNPYRVKQISFTGNIEIRDRTFRDKFNKFLSEGDVFSRQKFYQGLKNLNKLKVIYAVHLEDVEISLDEKEKYIELTVTVREKRHSKALRQNLLRIQ